MSEFTDTLFSEVMHGIQNSYTDNYDENMQYDSRFSKNGGNNIFARFLNKYVPISYRLPIKRNLLSVLNPAAFYREVVKRFEDAASLYDSLNDEASKSLLIRLLAYRILGHTKIKLPRNNPTYWADIEKLRQCDTGQPALKIKFIDLMLKVFDLNKIGYPITVHATAEGASALFKQKQYEYHGAEVIKVEPGDVVMDCGACWGETSLYFANEAKPNGSVYSFEFIDANVDVFNKNLALNPHLNDRIHLVKHPVWDKSDEILTFADNGPGSSVTDKANGSSNQCQTIAIDDLVAREGIQKVNFIKMDIEGAELQALQGSVNTIKRDKPKLAISLYHKEEDFSEIPKFINSLNMGYRLYLEHHTIHYWETVLFAI